MLAIAMSLTNGYYCLLWYYLHEVAANIKENLTSLLQSLSVKEAYGDPRSISHRKDSGAKVLPTYHHFHTH